MTELAIRDDIDVMTLGQVLSQSGYFQDAKDASQAIVKVLAGRELGIPPVAAMTGIYIVQGRVSLGANLMAAAVKRSGKYNYRVLKMDDTVCEIAFFEGKEQIGVSSFTIQDAKKAGTKNTDKFPRNMLFARAMSNGVRWYCPDVFTGPVYTPEEFDDTPVLDPAPTHIDRSTGEIIDAAAPSQHDKLLAEAREVYKQLKAAGLDSENVQEDVKVIKALSIGELRGLIATWRAALQDDAPAAAPTPVEGEVFEPTP